MLRDRPLPVQYSQRDFHRRNDKLLVIGRSERRSAMAANPAAEQQQSLPLPSGTSNGCWKSTPGTGVAPPPRLSLSAILPLSAAGSYQNQPHQQHQQQRRSKESRRSAKNNNDSDRTMLPGAVAGTRHEDSTTLARRFFAIPRVRRSLAIDIASVLIFVPLSVSTSIALLRLFVRRRGQEHLEWHHYMLVAALASLVLVPICRLAYSGQRYRHRIRRMQKASRGQQHERERLTEYTTRSRRIEAADAARAQEYRQFARLVAKQQKIDLSRRGDLSVAGGTGGGAAPDRSASNISGLSCHRPDISMAAYNC